ncbi:MAG: hypothetical protein H7A25_22670 [Leptospiraceae bacterium]|nr:hypothetical protein [Leptospiraceae bacterium]MCP5502720.1 hypothetical protein [Leptospiraceae bacterium]
MPAFLKKTIVFLLIISISNCISSAVLSIPEFERSESKYKYYSNTSTFFLTYEEEIDRNIFPNSTDMIQAEIGLLELFKKTEADNDKFRYGNKQLPDDAKLLYPPHKEGENCHQACSDLKSDGNNYCLQVKEQKKQKFLVLEHCSKRQTVLYLPMRDSSYTAYWTYPVVAVTLPVAFVFDIITLPLQVYIVYLISGDFLKNFFYLILPNKKKSEA